MCKGTVAFLSDPPLKGKTHTQTHSFKSIQTKLTRTHKPTPSLPSFSPFSLSFSLFLNNSGAERSPEASEGPKLNRPNLASDPGAATRPLGGGLQCIPGESIVKAKHFLWSRASPTTITFHTFISWLESHTLSIDTNREQTHTCACIRARLCIHACMFMEQHCKTLFGFLSLLSYLSSSLSKCSHLRMFFLKSCFLFSEAKLLHQLFLSHDFST